MALVKKGINAAARIMSLSLFMTMLVLFVIVVYKMNLSDNANVSLLLLGLVGCVIANGAIEKKFAIGNMIEVAANGLTIRGKKEIFLPRETIQSIQLFYTSPGRTWSFYIKQSSGSLFMYEDFYYLFKNDAMSFVEKIESHKYAGVNVTLSDMQAESFHPPLDTRRLLEQAAIMGASFVIISIATSVWIFWLQS